MRIVMSEASVPAPFASDDRIFLGEGLFETLRIVNGNPRYAELHWARLQKAAALLGIPFDLSCGKWEDTLLTTLQKAGVENGGIKVLLSAGSAKRGLAHHGKEPCLVIQAFPYQPCSSPLKLITAPWLRDANNPIYRFKSVNYLEAIMALRQAKSVDADDVLFFNQKNHATETTIANLFLIHEGVLCTPSLNCGLLAGVIRQRILSIAEKLGIAFAEQEISRSMIASAEGLFLCNALQGIRPVVALDEQMFSKDCSLVRKLQKLLELDKG